MNAQKAWIVYASLRLVLFAIPLTLFIRLGYSIWLSALLATLIATSLSIIFLRKSRSKVSGAFYEWRNKNHTADDLVEDKIVDSQNRNVTEPAKSAEVTQDKTKE
jgi:Protein of unknown function (DUF4229)